MAFQQVGEREEPDAPGQVVQHPAAQQANAVAAQLLGIALRALSERAIVAIGNLFTILTVGSCWWLWMQAPPDPSTRQLVGLGLYGLFVLLLHVIRGRKA